LTEKGQTTGERGHEKHLFGEVEGRGDFIDTVMGRMKIPVAFFRLLLVSKGCTEKGTKRRPKF
jgi:hypothetical protein